MVVLKTLALAGVVIVVLFVFAVLYFGGTEVDSNAGLACRDVYTNCKPDPN
jgi:hypothetical protein